MAEERCYISNVESGGQAECRLVRKDNRFAYYTHVYALEGTKTPFIRKCELEIWNKHCFMWSAIIGKIGKSSLTGIDRKFQEAELDADYNAMSDYYEDNPEW